MYRTFIQNSSDNFDFRNKQPYFQHTDLITTYFIKRLDGILRPEWVSPFLAIDSHSASKYKLQYCIYRGFVYLFVFTWDLKHNCDDISLRTMTIKFFFYRKIKGSCSSCLTRSRSRWSRLFECEISGIVGGSASDFQPQKQIPPVTLFYLRHSTSERGSSKKSTTR